MNILALFLLAFFSSAFAATYSTECRKDHEVYYIHNCLPAGGCDISRNGDLLTISAGCNPSSFSICPGGMVVSASFSSDITSDCDLGDLAGLGPGSCEASRSILYTYNGWGGLTPHFTDDISSTHRYCNYPSGGVYSASCQVTVVCEDDFCSTSQARYEQLLAQHKSECENEYGGTYVAGSGGQYTSVPGYPSYRCVDGRCEMEEEWEDDPIICPGSGSNFLGKKSYAGGNYNSKEYVSYDSYEAWGKNTKVFYDALGRKTQAHPETRRYLFLPKIDKYTDLQNVNLEFGSIVLKENTANKSCGNIGVDYGIELNGKKIGGINCYDVYAKTDYPEEFKIVGTCTNGSPRYQADFDFILTPELTRNSIHYVQKGYKYPESNYIVTEYDEFAVMWHEKGHQKYNECIVFVPDTIHYSGCYCKTTLEKKMQQEKNKIEQKYIDIIKNLRDSLHKTYSDTGYATTYECPNY
jgi:hypothetical protein